jgi:hypothetical protein
MLLRYTQFCFVTFDWRNEADCFLKLWDIFISVHIQRMLAHQELLYIKLNSVA